MVQFRQVWGQSVLVGLLVVLAACGPAPAAADPTAAATPAAPTAPAATMTAAPAPTTAPPPTATTAPAVAPIGIGVLVDSGNLAPYGEEMWRGLQLGLRYATEDRLSVAGRPLELLREEVASVDAAVSAVNRLAGQGVALLVGPIGSNSANVVKSMIEGITREGLVYFASSAAPRLTAENWSPNLFRLCHVSPAEGPIVPASAQEKVTVEFFANLDVPNLPAATVGQVGLLPYHYTFPKNAANDWFVAQYRAEYGAPPDTDTECGFATGQAIVAGLMASGGEAAPAGLIPALEGLTFEGPRGAYEIRAADHQGLAPVFIVRLTNTNDSEQAYYELLQEIPGAEAGLPCTAARCP